MKNKRKKQRFIREFILNSLISRKRNKLWLFLKVGIISILLITFFVSKNENLKFKWKDREVGKVRDLRVGKDFNKGETKGADYKDNKLFLLKENRVERENTKYANWNTFNLDIKGDKIGVGEKLILIKSKDGKIYSYNKKMKNKKLIHDNKSSLTMKTTKDISNIKAYKLTDNKILLENQKTKKVELYNLMLNSFEKVNIKSNLGIVSGLTVYNSGVLIGSDKGIYYFDKALNTISRVNNSGKDVLDVFIKLDKLFVLTTKREVIMYDLSNKNQITLENKKVLLDNSKYLGGVIKEANILGDNLIILNEKNKLQSYDIKRRKWHLINLNALSFYLNKNLLLVKTKDRATVYNSELKKINEYIGKPLKVYTRDNDFLCIFKGKEKNYLMKLDKDSSELVGEKNYSGDLSKVDEVFLSKNKENLYVFTIGKELETYNFKKREWTSSNFKIKAIPKRIRENNEGIYFQESNVLYQVNKSSLIIKAVQKNIKSFDVFENKLVILNTKGELYFNTKKHFGNNSKFDLSTIKKIIEKDNLLYFVFSQGIESYSKESRRFLKTFEFKKKYSYISQSKDGSILILENNNLYRVYLKDGNFENKEIYTFKKNVEILDLKVSSNKNQIFVLGEENNREKNLYTFDTATYSLKLKKLSNGTIIKNLDLVKKVVFNQEDMYLTYENSILKYNMTESNWKVLYNGKNMANLQVTVRGEVFFQENKDLFHLKNGKKTLIRKNIKGYYVNDSSILILGDNLKIISNWKTEPRKASLFAGTLSIKGSIRNLIEANNNIYFTDSMNLWNYNKDTYSFKKLTLGERSKEIITKESLFYKKGNLIYKVNLNNLKRDIAVKESDDFWTSNSKIYYSNKEKLYTIEDNKSIKLFEQSRADFSLSDVKEYNQSGNALYVILNKNGIRKYDLYSRKWEVITKSKVEKYLIEGNNIYFQVGNQIYENTLSVKSNNKRAKDFTVIGNGIYSIGTNNILYKNDTKLNYFSGKGLIKSVTSYAELNDKKIYGGVDSNNKGMISQYDTKTHSWKNTSLIFVPRNIFIKNNIIYISGKHILLMMNTSYEKLGDIKYFGSDIKNITIDNNRVGVLLNNHDYYLKINGDWKKISNKKLTFDLGENRNYFLLNSKVYIASNKGLFSYNTDIDSNSPTWQRELSVNLTNYNFKNYNYTLGLVGEKKAYIKLNNKWQSFDIDNYSFNRVNNENYYIKNGVLHQGNLTTKGPYNILNNTLYSFELNNRYYYISNKGIAIYNPKNHTWLKTSYSLDINSYSSYSNKRIISLNTKNGEYRMDSSNLKMISHENKNLDILEANENYVVITSNGEKELYRRSSYKSSELNRVFEKVNLGIHKIQGGYKENNTNYIVDSKAIYRFDNNKKAFEKYDEHHLGEIYNISKYKENMYLYGGNGYRYLDGAREKLNYSNYNGNYYSVKNGTLYLNGEKASLKPIKGIFSRGEGYLFTDTGTYYLNKDINMYTKIDEDKEQRIYSHGNLYQIKDEKIIVEKLSNKLYLRNISLSSEIQFSNKNKISTYLDTTGKISLFEKDEKPNKIEKVDDEIISFSTNKNKSYTLNLKTLETKETNNSNTLKTTTLTLNKTNIKGVIQEGDKVYLIGNQTKVTVTLDKENNLTFLKSENLNKKYEKLTFIAQENNDIILRSKGINYEGANLNNLKQKKILGKRNKVIYKNGVFDYLSLKNGENSIETILGVGDNAISGNRFKVDKPLEIKLDDKNRVAIIYLDKVNIDLAKDVNIESKIQNLNYDNQMSAFVVKDNIGYLNIDKMLRLSSYEPQHKIYHYMSSGEMKTTSNLSSFRKNLQENIGFRDDSFKTLSNNGNKIYKGTSNLIYDDNFNLVYQGNLDRINYINNNILVEKNNKLYSLLNKNLSSATNSKRIDNKYSLSYNNGWTQKEDTRSQLTIFGLSEKESLKSDGFVIDNIDDIYVGGEGTYLRKGNFIFKRENSGNYTMIKKEDKLKNIQGFYKSGTTFINYVFNRNTELRYLYSKDRYAKHLYTYSSEYPEDVIIKLSRRNQKLYLLNKDYIYKITNDNNMESKKMKVDSLFNIGGILFVKKDNKYYELKEDLSLELRGEPKIQVDLDRGNNIVYNNSYSKLTYSGFNEKNLYLNNVFIFDSLKNLFILNNDIYRYKDNIIFDKGLKATIFGDNIKRVENINGQIIIDGSNGSYTNINGKDKIDKYHYSLNFDELRNYTLQLTENQNSINYLNKPVSNNNFLKFNILSNINKNIYLFGNDILKLNTVNNRILINKSVANLKVSRVSKLGENLLLNNKSLLDSSDKITYDNSFKGEKIDLVSRRIDLKIQPGIEFDYYGFTNHKLLEKSKSLNYFTFDNYKKISNNLNYYSTNHTIFDFIDKKIKSGDNEDIKDVLETTNNSLVVRTAKNTPQEFRNKSYNLFENKFYDTTSNLTLNFNDNKAIDKNSILSNKINDIFVKNKELYLSSANGVYSINLSDASNKTLGTKQIFKEFLGDKKLYGKTAENKVYNLEEKEPIIIKNNIGTVVSIDSNKESSEFKEIIRGKIVTNSLNNLINSSKNNFSWNNFNRLAYGNEILTIDSKNKVFKNREQIKQLKDNVDFLTIKTNNYLVKNYKVFDLNGKPYDLEKLDKNLYSQLFPSKIGIVRNDGTWTRDISSEKLKIETLERKNNFIDGRFNFDYVEQVGSTYYLSKNSKWSFNNFKLLDKIPEISNSYRGLNKIYTSKGKLYDINGKETNGGIAVGEKWKWKINPKNYTLKFEGLQNNKLNRVVKNNRFEDDIINNISYGNGELWIGTTYGILKYPKEFRENGKLSQVKDVVKGKTKFYKSGNILGLNKLKVPEILENKAPMSYYKEPTFIFEDKNPVYFYVNKDGVYSIKNK